MLQSIHLHRISQVEETYIEIKDKNEIQIDDLNAELTKLKSQLKTTVAEIQTLKKEH